MEGIVLNAQTMRLPIDSAPHLRERYVRLMAAVESERAGDTCDEAKAFLECIFRTIINDRLGEVDEGGGYATFPQLFDQASSCLPTDSVSNKILRETRKLVELIGNIRNNYGSTSHGKDGYDYSEIDFSASLHVARETLSIAHYMFDMHTTTPASASNARIRYEDNVAFNEYIDFRSDDVNVNGIVMIPSEVLFNTDVTAYREQLLGFQNGGVSHENV